MTTQKIDTTQTVANFVAQAARFEAEASASVAAIKDLTGRKNTAKISAYAHIIAGLIDLKVRKGSKLAGQIKADLVVAGVSKSCAKRYIENGQKAKAIDWVKAAGSDAEAILAAFEENGVRTEQDLVNIVSPPKPVLTAAEELAVKAVALTDSDEDAVQALRDATATLVAALAAAVTPLDLAA
jgi:hypothetical protein